MSETTKNPGLEPGEQNGKARGIGQEEDISELLPDTLSVL